MEKLPVMERFYTLQGEGAYQGMAAYFVRLGGCDVGCHWCDVKESWDKNAHPEVSIDQLVEGAQKYNSSLIVVTGGEPLMHNCDGLTNAFSENGFQLNVETSGTHPLTGKWDWICFSPKKFKKPLPEYYESADELKVVVFNQSDFKWAEEHASKLTADCQLYLQPEWSVREKMTPRIIEYIKSNPKWRLSLQSHKYVNIP
ncbi:MAG: 7-carboxy-7-deazaguanine synthase QueE [Bacteroidota bacterium]